MAMPLIVLWPIITVVFIIFNVMFFCICVGFLFSGEGLTLANVAKSANELANAANAAAGTLANMTATAAATAAAAASAKLDTMNVTLPTEVGGVAIPSVSVPLPGVAGKAEKVLSMVKLVGGMNVTYNYTLPPQYAKMDVTNYLALIELFGFLWTLQFNLAILTGVVAGAVMEWYWTSHDDDHAASKEGKKGSDHQPVLNFPILTSFKNLIRYYMGSMLHGSFWIALVQFIRIIVAYIMSKTEKLREGNKALKALAMVITCCLWCLEKIVKYVSRMAFILVILEDKHFCGAGWHAVKLIVGNKARFAFVTIFAQASLILGKILIMALSGGSIYTLIVNYAPFDKVRAAETREKCVLEVCVRSVCVRSVCVSSVCVCVWFVMYLRCSCYTRYILIQCYSLFQ